MIRQKDSKYKCNYCGALILAGQEYETQQTREHRWMYYHMSCQKEYRKTILEQPITGRWLGYDGELI